MSYCRTKRCADEVLGHGWAVGISGVKHRDHGNCPRAIKLCPLALHQRVLHRSPVFEIAGSSTPQGGIRNLRGFAVVEEGQEFIEPGKIDAHLVNELTHSHLLRSAHLVEIAAISSRVIDGLNGGHAQKKRAVLVGNLWS